MFRFCEPQEQTLPERGKLRPETTSLECGARSASSSALIRLNDLTCMVLLPCFKTIQN